MKEEIEIDDGENLKSWIFRNKIHEKKIYYLI